MKPNKAPCSTPEDSLRPWLMLSPRLSHEQTTERRPAMITARMMINTGLEGRNNTTASANDDDNTTQNPPGNPWRRRITAVWTIIRASHPPGEER
jgi:hypothetical protein